jgi:hypothetical protein
MTSAAGKALQLGQPERETERQGETETKRETGRQRNKDNLTDLI